MIRQLGISARLVISHASDDEGDAYEHYVRKFANLFNVPTNFVSDIIQNERGVTLDGRKIYALGDVYAQADLVTYPSDLEDFGNAFLEAIYYRRPIVVNTYCIDIDIKPKGFRVIEFDGVVNDETVRQVQRVLQDAELACEITEHNVQIAQQYYSYDVLERRLQMFIADCFGEEDKSQ